jgi:hypothetical protein
MDLFKKEDWQPHSDRPAMFVAEYRLRNLRRVSKRSLAIHGEMMNETRASALRVLDVGGFGSRDICLHKRVDRRG